MIGDLSLSVMQQAFVEARDWDARLGCRSTSRRPAAGTRGSRRRSSSCSSRPAFRPTGWRSRSPKARCTTISALAQSIVGSLKNQGIRLALDDFGTGYSSLAHLRALPFDRIKIDKSFVTSMMDNSESAAIVNAITKLGEGLGLPVTAEGVETARDRASSFS